MTQLTGSISVEVSARNLAHTIGAELIAQGLADAVADRVIERLHEAARQATGGESDSRYGAHSAGEGYERSEAGQ